VEDSLNLDTMLAQYVREFEESEDATREARTKAERDRDYYDEKQWTADEIATLDARGQPAITFNRIKRKVNSMTGLEKQTRKDPKAFPRNPDDEQAASAATDACAMCARRAAGTTSARRPQRNWRSRALARS
jgi:hypothetical protein